MKTDDAKIKADLARLEKLHNGDAARSQALNALSDYANQAYRWARVDRRTAHYQPQAFSGDAAIYGAADMMNRRTRDQVRNDSVTKGIVRKLTDLVVGSGLRTYADPIELSLDLSDVSTLDDQLEMALEMDSAFERFYLDEKAFDVEGKLSGPDMERGGFREQVTVGDTLILRVRMKRPGVAVPLCYQLIERDQLDAMKDRSASGGQNRIVNGVELDAYNRPVAYHILDAHPGDSFQPFQASMRSTRIPADRVIHAYAFGRPSQSIGATWLDAIGQDNFDEDKLVSAELQTAAKAALMAIYVNRKNPYSGSLGLSDGEDSADAYGNEEFKMSGSPLAVELGLDETAGIVESARPNTDVGVFLDHLAHRKASGCGLSYYTLTDNFANTNYTGFRGAMLNEDMAVQPIQNWYGRKVVLPMRREFNALAAALGIYKRISTADFVRDEQRFQTFDLISPGRQYLEPESETNASMANLRAGLSTLKIECARRGLHWIKVLRQAAIENRVIELFGLTIDFSKGQGGQVTGTTRAGGQQEQAAPAKGAANAGKSGAR